VPACRYRRRFARLGPPQIPTTPPATRQRRQPADQHADADHQEHQIGQRQLTGTEQIVDVHRLRVDAGKQPGSDGHQQQDGPSQNTSHATS
jgi:hypothetical protein